MPPKVLIVDDEPDITELIAVALKRMKIASHSVATLDAAKSALQADDFNLCITDMRLKNENGKEESGIDLVHHLQAAQPQLPVAVITAYATMETAIEAMKAGAFDFVPKPIELDMLRNLVNTALNRNTPSPSGSGIQQHKILGESAVMQSLRRQIGKYANSDAPVLINGESGTGKELAARAIHAQSPRRAGPFIAVNCGAIPAELMESEFFGHRKGSFTGAIADKEGLFQAASGGTLFLDEIAELPLPMQVKLLRVLQERSVRPIGETREGRIDCRIISATHQNLAQRVKEKHFRQDLLYRLNVLDLRTPSLREHSEDIPLLAESVLQRIVSDSQTPKISPKALEKLTAYSFPGNVRELENILERALALCDGSSIQLEDLQTSELMTSHSADTGAIDTGVVNIGENLSPADDWQGRQEPLDDYISRVERSTIEKTLAETKHNITAAAEKLGVSYRALRYKIKKLGI